MLRNHRLSSLCVSVLPFSTVSQWCVHSPKSAFSPAIFRSICANFWFAFMEFLDIVPAACQSVACRKEGGWKLFP
jgi:hypothetical protein